MTEKSLKSLKLLGDGSSPGGEYEKIKVTGQGKVNGDVSSIQGKIIGEWVVNGNAAIDQFHLIGKGKIEGELLSDDIKVTGDLHVRHNVKGNSFQIKGYVTAEGNIHFEKMEIKGGINSKGLLNVGELFIHLQVAPSKVHEIGGENVTITSKRFFSRSKTLEVDVIEGDNIYLEQTTAKIVRGNQIEIGPGCHIDLIEYRETFKCKERNRHDIEDIKQI